MGTRLGLLIVVVVVTVLSTAAGEDKAVDPRTRVRADEVMRDARIRPWITDPWHEEEDHQVRFAPFGGLFSIEADRSSVTFRSYPAYDAAFPFSDPNKGSLLAWCHMGPERIAVSWRSRPGQLVVLRRSPRKDDPWNFEEETVLQLGEGRSAQMLQYSEWSDALLVHAARDTVLYSVAQKKLIAVLAMEDWEHPDRQLYQQGAFFSRNGKVLAVRTYPKAGLTLYILPKRDELRVLPAPVRSDPFDDLGPRVPVNLWQEDGFLLRDGADLRFFSPTVSWRRPLPEKIGLVQLRASVVLACEDEQIPPQPNGATRIRRLRIYRGPQLKEEVDLPGTEDYQFGVISPNGRVVACGRAEYGVMITFFDTETGRPLLAPEVNIGDDYELQFTPEGSDFLTIGHKEFRLWRTPVLLKERADGLFERVWPDRNPSPPGFEQNAAAP